MIFSFTGKARYIRVNLNDKRDEGEASRYAAKSTLTKLFSQYSIAVSRLTDETLRNIDLRLVR